MLTPEQQAETLLQTRVRREAEAHAWKEREGYPEGSDGFRYWTEVAVLVGLSAVKDRAS